MINTQTLPGDDCGSDNELLNIARKKKRDK